MVIALSRTFRVVTFLQPIPQLFPRNRAGRTLFIITTADCRFKTLFETYLIKFGNTYWNRKLPHLLLFYGLKCIILFCLRSSVAQALERLCVQLSAFQRESQNLCVLYEIVLQYQLDRIDLFGTTFCNGQLHIVLKIMSINTEQQN